MNIERISRVTSVEAHVHKTDPPRLHVTAIGEASSGSHLNARLMRRVYIIFPEDGIQEYDFIVDVPGGISTSDIKEHKVEDHWDSFPAELKGVRVYAQVNHMEDGV